VAGFFHKILSHNVHIYVYNIIVLLYRKDCGLLISLIMSQWMEWWSITSVHLVIVTVVRRMMVVIYVTVCFIMTTTIASVFVIDKVSSECYCLVLALVWATTMLGYLCGKCRGDRGVSVLLNKCVSCDHSSIAIIFGLG